MIIYIASNYALVAQGIEQRFPVPRVGGSNPSRRVFFFSDMCGPADGKYYES